MSIIFRIYVILSVNIRFIRTSLTFTVLYVISVFLDYTLLLLILDPTVPGLQYTRSMSSVPRSAQYPASPASLTKHIHSPYDPTEHRMSPPTVLYPLDCVHCIISRLCPPSICQLEASTK